MDTFGALPIFAIFVAAVGTAYFGGQLAIRHLPAKGVTSIFVLMVTLSLLRYAADLLQLL